MVYKNAERQRAYVREWNLRNYYQRRADWFASRGGACEKCGSKEKLECDHIERSKKVHHRIWTWSDERRNEELKKCQALCEKCHLEKTTKEFQLKPGGHGLWKYIKYKCRCDICCEAKRLSAKKHKESWPNRKASVLKTDESVIPMWGCKSVTFRQTSFEASGDTIYLHQVP